MREIMIALGQNPAGACLAVWTGLAALSFVIWYGFYVIALPGMALVTGTRILVGGCSKEKGHKEYGYAISPRLGYTMADGGKTVEK